MDKLLSFIKPQEKVSYESQIALWYFYNIEYRENIDFENYIMSEPLIYKFNNAIQNQSFKKKFITVLDKNIQEINRLLDIFHAEPWKIIKPVIWRNNLDNVYFIENLTLSHRFEIYIDYLFNNHGIDMGLYYGRDGQHNGETQIGVEIKRDMKLVETGNIYIEYAEKHNANNERWVNSGILKNDNTRYFLIGDINEYYILRKRNLIDIYNRLIRKQYVHGCKMTGAGRRTSLGFIMSRSIAANITLSIQDVINEL